MTTLKDQNILVDLIPLSILGLWVLIQWKLAETVYKIMESSYLSPYLKFVELIAYHRSVTICVSH